MVHYSVTLTGKEIHTKPCRGEPDYYEPRYKDDTNSRFKIVEQVNDTMDSGFILARESYIPALK
jgi:hypothetical protein